jgi:hypothetical protein
VALNDVSHEADSSSGFGCSGLGGGWFFMLGYDRQGHRPVNYGCLRKCKNDKLYGAGNCPALLFACLFDSSNVTAFHATERQ